jgi:hypothetical protein
MGLIGSGVVGPGAAEHFDVLLTGNHTYQVFVNPVNPGVDFDLHVFDENGIQVTEDISPSADAYCVITPRWTGPFRLVVNSIHGVSAYQIQVQE